VGLTAGWTLVVLGLMAWLIDSVAFYDANTFMLQWLLVPVGGAALIRLAPAIDAGMARGLAAAESWPSAIGATLLNAIGAWRLIGVASYSIYLWHCIVLAGFRHEEMFGPTWLWWFMAFLSLLTGILSWKYIELRFYSFGTSAQRQK
jgi:peptidoglycan/LPS O-acetylase OafA/YrhL